MRSERRLSIAFLGTLGGALLAFPVSLLAARNVVANRIVHLLTRRSLDTIRGVDTLIWALIWVGVVGLGPFAGILAVICSDFGTFGKLFSEAIEAADKNPAEGVRSAGGNHLHGVRFGLLPQVIPILLSQVLYYFESNTRSATIIGIVGAGGIGLQLAEQIRVLEWQKVSFLILLILITVSAIDWISGKLRFAIIGKRAIASLAATSHSRPRTRPVRRQSARAWSAAACPRHRRRCCRPRRIGRPSARSSRAASVASTIAAVTRVEARR